MESIHLEAYIRSAAKIFVWLQLSPQRGLYVKATKAALLEYLTSPDNVFNEDIYIEYGLDQELYLGRSPEE
jgi:hypothetical protein